MSNFSILVGKAVACFELSGPRCKDNYWARILYIFVTYGKVRTQFFNVSYHCCGTPCSVLMEDTLFGWRDGGK
jgi:hypothetical protein